jgi:hypothetical protein
MILGAASRERALLLRALVGQLAADGPSHRNRILRGVTLIRRGDRGRQELFDGEVDPDRQLPQELRDRGDGGRQGDLLVDLERRSALPTGTSEAAFAPAAPRRPAAE